MMFSLILVAFLCLIPALYYILKPFSIPSIPNATPNLPILGNAISFGVDPINFLLTQRVRHGDIFLVNLGIFNVVFFLGPEGTNAVYKGTDRGGISFLAAMVYLIGPPLEKGLATPEWPEIGRPIMQSSLTSPEYLEYWTPFLRDVVRKRFCQWAQRDEPISLFREISDLVMTALFYLFVGPEFTERHKEELVPMVRTYEQAMQKPQTKVLPRWMSGEGRFLDLVEDRIKSVINEDIARRKKNMDGYRDNMDYLQIILNQAGFKYSEVYGYHILTILNGAHTNITTTFTWSLLHAIRSPLLTALRKAGTKDLLQATFRETGRIYTNLIALRKVTIPQVIMGRPIPKGTFVACSPVVTARDPQLFPEPDKFLPQRWLREGKYDETYVKQVQRVGASVQFGKGQHACLGEKVAKAVVIDTLWDVFLGNDQGPGFDVEIVSGVREGVGFDGVGVEGAWTEENLGTPFEKGQPVMVRFKRLST